MANSAFPQDDTGAAHRMSGTRSLVWRILDERDSLLGADLDADGDVAGPARDRLLAQVTDRGVRDLIVFAHGWNSDRSSATALYRRFFAPVPKLAPKARLGYVGVVWPSMRFSDEPIPDFPRSVAAVEAAAEPRPALDKDTRRALLETFPGRTTVLDQLARMLDDRPDGVRGWRSSAGWWRLLLDADGPQGVADTDEDGEPAVFAGDPVAACEEFAGALAALDASGGAAFGVPNPWEGAKELLRQAAYYRMKRRAGTVGERGLGPVLGRLAKAAPGVRGAPGRAQLRRSAGGVRAARAARGSGDGEVGDPAPGRLLALRVRGPAAARPGPVGGR